MFLILLLMGACSTIGSNENILDLGQTPGIDCIPGEKGDSRMFGDTFLRHLGDKEIRITEVSLIKPDNLALAEAFMLKLEPNEALVGFGDWPPNNEDSFPLPKEWENRIQAKGAKIQPGEEWNLVFVLTSNASVTSSSKGIKIVYKDSDGKKYVQETLIQYAITSRTCSEVLEENSMN